MVCTPKDSLTTDRNIFGSFHKKVPGHNKYVLVTTKPAQIFARVIIYLREPLAHGLQRDKKS